METTCPTSKASGRPGIPLLSQGAKDFNTDSPQEYLKQCCPSYIRALKLSAILRSASRPESLLEM